MAIAVDQVLIVVIGPSPDGPVLMIGVALDIDQVLMVVVDKSYALQQFQELSLLVTMAEDPVLVKHYC